MNEKLKQLIEQVGTDSSGKWMRIDQVENFYELITHECLTALDNTNQHHAYTTFDKDLIQTTINKSKIAIKNHFGV